MLRRQLYWTEADERSLVCAGALGDFVSKKVKTVVLGEDKSLCFQHRSTSVIKSKTIVATRTTV
jgi:hypothetical protein